MDFRQSFRTRVWLPALGLLRQGLTPHKLTLSVVVGACFGVIPIPGVATLLAGGIALLFRLNQPAVQMANYAVYVPQFALILPFIGMGEWMFDAEKLPFSAHKLLDMLREDPGGTLAQFYATLLHAVAAWAVSSLVAGTLMYFILKPVFARLSARLATPPSPVT